MTIIEKFKDGISKLIQESDLVNDQQFDFKVSFIDITNNKFGDISSNLALILAKKLGKDLKEIGEILLKETDLNIKNGKELSKIIEKVELAKNGFINFFLKDQFIIEELERISNLENIQNRFTGEKVLIEHSSPNLFKPFHIGHLMNNIIGEALTKMLKTSDSEVKVVSFLSDISLGIAKAIYILKNKKNWSFFNQDIIQTLGKAYTEGVEYYDNNEEKQEEIKEVARNLFSENKLSEDWRIYERAREVNIEYFKSILAKLGTKLDKIIYESEAGKIGEKIVKENLNGPRDKEVFEIGESGAIVYDTRKLKNSKSNETIKSVFINSEGHPTYEAKDLGLLKLKYDYFSFKESIFITDNEQIPHFAVVLEVTKKLGGDLENIAKESIHIAHGRLNLSGERMSSRLGNVLSVEELLEKLKEKVIERLGGKTKDYNQIEKEELVLKISLAALKIAILKSKPGLNINFDLETSLNFEGATGPYLLYTYARANSILEKSEVNSKKELRITENNRELILKLIEMENNLLEAIEKLSPQLIVKYLFELAQSFNTFYGKVKIISEDKEETENNLALVEKFRKIFKFILNSIGIEEVNKM